MVVLGILGIVATIRTSSLSSTARLQWASRQVARDLSFARERAMTTGTTHWVRFDTTNQFYTILAESTTTPGYASATTITDPSTNNPLVVNLNRNDWNGITLSTGGTFSTINYTVGFNRLGRPLSTAGTAISASTGPTLTVGSVSPSPATTVTVTAGTGRIVY